MIELGKEYLVERNGRKLPALVLAYTSFQAQVEIDGEDQPIWIPLNALGQEYNEEPQEEPALLNLLVNAQALIERAIVDTVNKQEAKWEFCCPKCGSIDMCSTTGPMMNSHSCVDCGYKWKDEL